MEKQPWEWLEDDLLRMKEIGTQEKLHLEFKESAALTKEDREKNDLSKFVSAFANTDGGTIIYGVKEVGNPPSRFGDIDDGFDPSVISPEYIEDVIASRIERPISGIRINPVMLTKTHPGRVAYVIHVPISYDAPHQAHNNKYYMRHNFKCEPMADWQVRDVQNRRTKPLVDVEITGHKLRPTSIYDGIKLTIRIKNIGNRMAKIVYLRADVPELHMISGRCQLAYGTPEYKVTIDDEMYYQIRYYIEPLFPGDFVDVLDGNQRYVNLKFTKEDRATPTEKDKFIHWTIFADEANPRTGEVSIRQLFRESGPL